MFMKQERKRASEAVGRLYFFLLSDAYREFREAEVRWECYAASQYHFDDGVNFILEAVGPIVPVDHPIWGMYSEKVTETGARVARAEQRRMEKLSGLKGLHQAFLRFCRDKRIDPTQVAGADRAFPDHIAAALKDSAIEADARMADETYRLLDEEWEAHTVVGDRR
jgi:hypothetical protein